LGVALPDELDVVGVSASRIRGEIVAREGDRLQAVARARELEVIAVVSGYAALVDVEPDAPVRGDPGLQVRDADGDVIDAGKNGCALRVGAEDSTSVHRGSQAARPLAGL
jgi:hypothetical protein